MMTGEPEGIKHLHLVSRLQVATAIASSLAAGFGLKRRAEFHMKLVALKALHAVSTLHQKLVLRHLSGLEFIRAGAIKQHHRALGRLGAERWALACDLLQRPLIGSGHLQAQRFAFNHRRKSF